VQPWLSALAFALPPEGVYDMARTSKRAIQASEPVAGSKISGGIAGAGLVTPGVGLTQYADDTVAHINAVRANAAAEDFGESTHRKGNQVGSSNPDGGF
jgi:hypothetical protein